MRNEYPRMDERREEYQILNGKWNFMFDDNDEGIKQKWFVNFPENYLSINVPFAYQTELSGINSQTIHDLVWYQQTFSINKGHSELNFGAVDYESDIYINGEFKLHHTGGETSFKLPLFFEDEQEINIVVRVYDPHYDEEIPRGKQTWEEESRGIWYTPTTGIWQSVWIDYIGEKNIINYKAISNVDSGIQTITINTSSNSINELLKVEVFDEDNLIYSSEQKIIDTQSTFSFDMYNKHIFKTSFHGNGTPSICWTPENPRLFDIKISIVNHDILYGYFGFRKIHSENGVVHLNNRPYIFKLILDQGYWKEGLLTAPSDDDYIKDIELSKKMGFNGCRKHQKVEDPRFLYWADKLGFLVWGEIASAPFFTDKAVENIQKEWFEIIKRDFNHPSIVAWVPINESWGVPNVNLDKQQQAHTLSLYYQIKSLDKTRLVVNNDGWEQTITDICAVHNYNHGNIDEVLKVEHFDEVIRNKAELLKSNAAGRPLYAQGYEYVKDTPIMITEYGGIGFDLTNPKGWGYTSVQNAEELVSEYARIMKSFEYSDYIAGFCYTQLCDVEQEVNGLLTYDRTPKCDLDVIKEINDKVQFIKYF